MHRLAEAGEAASLTRSGCAERVQGACDERRAELQTQYNRLVGHGDYTDEHGNAFRGMGEVYKAVAITSKRLGVPPGFEQGGAEAERGERGGGSAEVDEFPASRHPSG